MEEARTMGSNGETERLLSMSEVLHTTVASVINNCINVVAHSTTLADALEELESVRFNAHMEAVRSRNEETLARQG